MAALALVACGPPVAGGAADTAHALAAALQAQDAPALARLTGSSADRIVAAREDAGSELVALGSALGQASVEPRARVFFVDGGSVELVQDGEAWRIDRGTLGRPILARPVDAVAALHVALSRSRAQALLAVMSRGQRAELATELERWIAATADPEALEISVQGEHALAVTPTGEQIDLVREAGEWRVLELR